MDPSTSQATEGSRDSRGGRCPDGTRCGAAGRGPSAGSCAAGHTLSCKSEEGCASAHMRLARPVNGVSVGFFAGLLPLPFGREPLSASGSTAAFGLPNCEARCRLWVGHDRSGTNPCGQLCRPKPTFPPERRLCFLDLPFRFVCSSAGLRLSTTSCRSRAAAFELSTEPALRRRRAPGTAAPRGPMFQTPRHAARFARSLPRQGRALRPRRAHGHVRRKRRRP
jgi:hypothetical protein